MMTAFVIADPADVHVVDPGTMPNPNWLRPGIPGAGQQAFGDELLRRHRFVAIPSAVSTHSWNLIFLASAPAGAYTLKFQEAFALDTRLHSPGP
jgi:RES domain-containing protein